jgi:SAM-dependent methyltransferase
VTSLDFWEQPEQVAQFAGRDPDHRLVELLKQYPAPSAVPVLDLGCAGGRNTELLVRGGFDTMAADASRAMVEATRRRVAPLLGPSEAEQRVRVARMDDLRFASDASFDLVVALGIYQVAETEEEWRHALRETSRVLRIGGRCLVANFAPGTGSRATPPRRVPGSDFVYDGFRYGRSCLLTAADLDREFRRFGFSPEVRTESVDKGTPEHGRITVNALYRLLDHAGSGR